ncbi:MAG: Dabb family protein [Planctomycetes bacterium]|nr:Dabb family protein [Planctomycetota bacterium]
MFHSVTLFALKPGIPLDRVRTARTSLQALVETMPGVEHLTVTHNVATDRSGFNLVLFSGFENRKACEIFFRHPEYLRVMSDELGPIVEKWLTAQGDSTAPDS